MNKTAQQQIVNELSSASPERGVAVTILSPQFPQYIATSLLS